LQRKALRGPRIDRALASHLVGEGGRRPDEGCDFPAAAPPLPNPSPTRGEGLVSPHSRTFAGHRRLLAAPPTADTRTGESSGRRLLQP
jgi:hypothetical protein